MINNFEQLTPLNLRLGRDADASHGSSDDRNEAGQGGRGTLATEELRGLRVQELRRVRRCRPRAVGFTLRLPSGPNRRSRHLPGVGQANPGADGRAPDRSVASSKMPPLRSAPSPKGALGCDGARGGRGLPLAELTRESTAGAALDRQDERAATIAPPSARRVGSALRKLTLGPSGLPHRAAASEELTAQVSPELDSYLNRLIDAWEQGRRVAIRCRLTSRFQSARARGQCPPRGRTAAHSTSSWPRSSCWAAPISITIGPEGVGDGVGA